MSIEGFILIGCMLTMFVTFAAVLAWGAHQTNSIQHDHASQDNLIGSTDKQPIASEMHSRAA
jgi:Tfp pilus assembly protein PilV